MDTYTIAAAARLVGAPKGKLYQAIRTGSLQPAPTQTPNAALTVTAAALQAAGFAVPLSALPQPLATPDTASATETPPAPAVAASPTPTTRKTPTAEAPAVALEPEPPASAPPDSGAEQTLIVHLERALEQAHARELRLLDMLAQLTDQRSTPPVSEPQPARETARAPEASPRAATPAPLSGLRQQIVAVLQKHPEGLAPKTVQTRLQLDTEVGSTMKRMVRSGLLTRLAAGRYVVVAPAMQP